MLNDLIFVLRHLKKIIEEYGLLELYSSYASTLQQISESSTEELQTQLKNYRDKIRETHEQLEPKGWSYSQLQIFDRFGAKGIVGMSGYTKFQKALEENAANTPGAVQAITQLQQEITQLSTNVTNILSSLGSLAEEDSLLKGKAVVQVVFDEDVKIDILHQLTTQSKEWQQIIRAFSLLAKESPEKTTIVAINKSSPLSLWLVTAPLISKAVYHTIHPFLELWKDVLTLREHALALEKMRVEIQSDRLGLFKDIEEYEEKKINQVLEKVAGEYRLKELDSSSLNEAKAALLKAGPKLYEFITMGGKVDATEGGENDESSGSFLLQSEYENIYIIRENVQKLLAEVTKKKNEINPKEKNIEKKESKKRSKSRPGSS